MCGISLELFSCSCHAACAHNSCKIPKLLLNRGPDASSYVSLQLSKVSMVLKATVLWLQGAEPTVQPLTDEDGNVLLFNGDVLAGKLLPPEGLCDSLHLLQQLRSVGDAEVPSVMSSIIGPWSFIYFRKTSECVYFGRDVLGRHSLLWSKMSKSLETGILSGNNSESDRQLASFKNYIEDRPKELPHDPAFVLSSVDCDLIPLEEVPAKGIFVLNLKNNVWKPVMAEDQLPVAVIPWNGSPDNVPHLKVQHMNNAPFMSPALEKLNATVAETDGDQTTDCFEGNILEHLSNSNYARYTDDFLSLLERSVQRRVDTCPQVCLRCTQTSKASSNEPNTKHNDGGCGEANCSFGAETSFESNKLCHQGLGRSSRDLNNRNNDDNKDLGSGHTDGKSLDISESFVNSKSVCGHCRVAVLFSGGLDSAVVAFILHRCLPKGEIIDLINVAFPTRSPKVHLKKKNMFKYKFHECNESEELSKRGDASQEFTQDITGNFRHLEASGKSKGPLNEAQTIQNNVELPEIISTSLQNETKSSCDNGFEVPDRITGRECLKQLQTLSPGRRWNFVEVNVSRRELEEQRARRISSLLRPHNTVLDDSIGCALWFAGRAFGVAAGQPYTSTARVMLCGHGADEQLCGYSRHRSVYKSGGLRALLAEVRMEMERLPSRNLGRDDRVLADNARAPRFPYLDEDVVSYLNSLPIHVKADLRQPRGVGEKLLLRVLAYKLGLTVAAGLPKRAIQFGSRIAKMDDRKEQGNQFCRRLVNR